MRSSASPAGTASTLVDDDPRLVEQQRALDVEGELEADLVGPRREDVALHVRAVGRPHDARSEACPQDDPDRLADLFLVADELHALRAPADGKRPADPDVGIARQRRTRLGHPIITVGAPTATLAPHPAASPARSAGIPPTSTVELPIVNGVDGT